MDRLVPEALNRWLLRHYPHVWAVRLPAVLLLAIALPLPLFLIAYVAVALVKATFWIVLAGLSMLLLLCLLFWRGVQADVAIGDQRIRPALEDWRIAIFVAPVCFLLGVAVIAPLFAAMWISTPNADSSLCRTLSGLEIGAAYFPEDADTIKKFLEDNSATWKQCGIAPADAMQRAATARLQRDGATAQKDLQAFQEAMITFRRTSSEFAHLASDAAQCVRSPEPVRLSQLSHRKVTCWAVVSADIDFYLRADEFKARVERIAAARVSVVPFLMALGILSIWFAATLAAGASLTGVLLTWMVSFGLTGLETLGEVTADYLSLTSIALCVCFLAGLLASIVLPWSKKTIAIEGYVAVSSWALIAAAVGLLQNWDRQFSALLETSLILVAAYLLTLPIIVYIRKRAIVAPIGS